MILQEKRPFAMPLLFAAGFFALLAQALLFRDFLTVFEGSELSAGLFLFSWLWWVAAGAAVAWNRRVSDWACRRFELLTLLYIPAFILQQYLLLNARALSGAAEYEVIALWRLIAVPALFNAPVSLLTGLLFVIAAQWFSGAAAPTAKIYIVDAAGSCAGAVAVTLLLRLGMTAETVFLTAAAFLCLAVLLSRRGLSPKAGRYGRAAAPAALLAGIVCATAGFGGLGPVWREAAAAVQWRRLLPEGRYLGGFCTPQARYLYGDYRGEFSIVRWDSVCDSLPDTEAAASAAAVSLAEKPDARRILVIGSGSLAFCRTLCDIPEIAEVVWLDADPDYPATVCRLTASGEKFYPKLKTPRLDPREYLRGAREKFDLAAVRIAAPSSLTMNRYFSLDFYRLLQTALTPSSVLSVSFPGGENFLGRELVMTGASLLETLRKVFPSVILKPGTESVFFAAAAPGTVTADPAILAKRLTGIKNLPGRFSPEIFTMLFDKFAMDFQFELYRKTIRENGAALLNRDDAPVTFFHSFMGSLKKLGAAVNPSELPTPQTFLFFCGAAVAVYGIFRTAAARVRRSGAETEEMKNFGRDGRLTSFDLAVLVFVSAWLGMSAGIVLMFLFQLEQGALFLYFGLVNACFMLGVFCGGRLTEKFHDAGRERLISFAVTAAGTLGYLAVAAYGWKQCGPAGFAGLFWGAGFFTGIWLPRAAFILKRRGVSDRAAAAALDAVDQAGGALGGLLTAVLFLPLLGLRGMFILLAIAALFLLTQVPAAGKRFRRTAAVTAAALILAAGSGAEADGRNAAASWRLKAGEQTELAGGRPVAAAAVAWNGTERTFYRVSDGQGRERGYIFRSRDFAPEIKGYGGPLELIIFSSPEGRLISFVAAASRETPSHLKKVMDRRNELSGKSLRGGETGFAADAVTGATFTAKAITAILNEAGKNFFAALGGGKPAAGDIAPTGIAAPPPGGPRDIDIARCRQLIKEQKLSDHPASYTVPQTTDK